MKAKTWAIIILLFLCAVLLVQNMEVVTFQVFFWPISMSRIIAFPLLILIGVVIGFTAAKLTGKAHRDKKRKTSTTNY